MAESTLALTFEDLIIAVAEFLGLSPYGDGTGIASIPAASNAHDLDLCKRRVNDGWRRFINSSPSWNWMSPTFTLTMDPDGTSDRLVDSTTWRYYLRDGFHGHILGGFTYGDNTGRPILEEHPEDYIRNLHATAESAGYPRYYAIRPLGGDDARRWEAIFWPSPTAADVLTARCRIYPNKLIELTDMHNAGVQFDEAIKSACLCEAEKHTEDASGEKTADWAEALVRALAIDQRSVARRMGDYGGFETPIHRPYTGVDTYNDDPV